MPKNKFINLLPQEEFEASTFGRILRWAMGTFRIIVIVTEMVVMAAFLSRFWLDAKNSDLTQSIKIASSQIQVQSDFEKEFRNLQTKLKIFKFISGSPKSSDKYVTIAGKTPIDIVVSSITVHDASAQIKGVAGNESSISQFMSNIKSDTTVKKVELGAISSSQDIQKPISFQIDLTY